MNIPIMYSSHVLKSFYLFHFRVIHRLPPKVRNYYRDFLNNEYRQHSVTNDPHHLQNILVKSISSLLWIYKKYSDVNSPPPPPPPSSINTEFFSLPPKEYSPEHTFSEQSFQPQAFHSLTSNVSSTKKEPGMELVDL